MNRSVLRVKGFFNSRPIWVTHPERFVLREISIVTDAGSIIELIY